MSLQVSIPPSVNGIITHCVSLLYTNSLDSAIIAWKKCCGKVSTSSAPTYAADRLSLITSTPLPGTNPPEWEQSHQKEVSSLSVKVCNLPGALTTILWRGTVVGGSALSLPGSYCV